MEALAPDVWKSHQSCACVSFRHSSPVCSLGLDHLEFQQQLMLTVLQLSVEFQPSPAKLSHLHLAQKQVSQQHIQQQCSHLSSLCVRDTLTCLQTQICCQWKCGSLMIGECGTSKQNLVIL